jgi:hypothetical protein
VSSGGIEAAGSLGVLWPSMCFGCGFVVMCFADRCPFDAMRESDGWVPSGRIAIVMCLYVTKAHCIDTEDTGSR